MGLYLKSHLNENIFPICLRTFVYIYFKHSLSYDMALFLYQIKPLTVLPEGPTFI